MMLAARLTAHISILVATIGVASLAAAEQLVITKSNYASFPAGKIIDGAISISLPSGKSVTVVSESRLDNSRSL
jgi:hypothetical protein